MKLLQEQTLYQKVAETLTSLSVGECLEKFGGRSFMKAKDRLEPAKPFADGSHSGVRHPYRLGMQRMQFAAGTPFIAT